jgi:hypothetical protein
MLVMGSTWAALLAFRWTWKAVRAMKQAREQGNEL